MVVIRILDFRRRRGGAGFAILGRRPLARPDATADELRTV
jgi:hypothetical protein